MDVFDALAGPVFLIKEFDALYQHVMTPVVAKVVVVAKTHPLGSKYIAHRGIAIMLDLGAFVGSFPPLVPSSVTIRIPGSPNSANPQWPVGSPHPPQCPPIASRERQADAVSWETLERTNHLHQLFSLSSLVRDRYQH